MFSAGVMDAVPGIDVRGVDETWRAIMRAAETAETLARMHGVRPRPVARRSDCRAMATIVLQADEGWDGEERGEVGARLNSV